MTKIPQYNENILEFSSLLAVLSIYSSETPETLCIIHKLGQHHLTCAINSINTSITVSHRDVSLVDWAEIQNLKNWYANSNNVRKLENQWHCYLGNLNFKLRLANIFQSLVVPQRNVLYYACSILRSSECH